MNPSTDETSPTARTDLTDGTTSAQPEDRDEPLDPLGTAPHDGDQLTSWLPLMLAGVLITVLALVLIAAWTLRSGPS